MITEWEVAVLPAREHVASIVVVLPDLCTSCLGHAAWARGPALDCIIWSVEASMHCWIAGPAPLRFPKLILISHRPALRVGNSAACAGIVPERTREAAAPISRMQSSCV